MKHGGFIIMEENITKSVLANNLYDRMRDENGKPILTHYVANTIVDGIFDDMKKQLLNGKKISLQGFMSIENVYRKGRDGHNPRTGEDLEIPAKYVPVAHMSRKFKKQITDEFN